MLEKLLTKKNLTLYALLRIIKTWGNEMTKLEIERKFKAAGWTIVHGSKHDLLVSPTGQKIALPRHKGDIPKGTALKILKEAGLD